MSFLLKICTYIHICLEREIYAETLLRHTVRWHFIASDLLFGLLSAYRQPGLSVHLGFSFTLQSARSSHLWLSDVSLLNLTLAPFCMSLGGLLCSSAFQFPSSYFSTHYILDLFAIICCLSHLQQLRVNCLNYNYLPPAVTEGIVNSMWLSWQSIMTLGSVKTNK